jgi:phosphate transport system substrate-binding protein
MRALALKPRGISAERLQVQTINIGLRAGRNPSGISALKFLCLYAVCAGCWLLGAAPLLGQQRVALAGSGGSVEAPLFNVWTESFNRQSSSIQVGYIPTSSAEGIHDLRLLRGDFASGEIRITSEAKRASVRLEEIPIAVVSVVPVYNVPGAAHLRFTGELMAQIYLGEIVNWHDGRIAAVNPDTSLPDLPIVLVDRPEGSGTRHIFAEFVSRYHPAFRTKKNDRRSKSEIIGGGKAVAEMVTATAGSIGYVDRSLAIRYSLVTGTVRNAAGKFVPADLVTIQATLDASRRAISRDLGASLIDAPGQVSYPMVGFAWVYLPVSGISDDRRHALHVFLKWCLRDGQILALSEDFVPLPPDVAFSAIEKLEQLPVGN